MAIQKYRWSRDYESAEEELVYFLQSRHIQSEPWTAEAGTMLSAQQHAFDERIWCAEGSLTLQIAGQSISLQPGDTVTIPANASYEIIVGLAGCVCYQSTK
jgi:quercetin dioxygenase-like cupin family protein